MVKTAEFGRPVARVPQPGKCRICGCVEHRACIIPSSDGSPRPCGWADHTRTLCDNPECVAETKRELGFVEGRGVGTIFGSDANVRRLP